MKEYRSVDAPAEHELVIKKSRFIGRLFPVADLDQAQARIAEIKKKHWDASHNCSAVVIGTDGEYTKCSDDGEPQGTAGMPMLEALKGAGLTYTLAVVTRYFGGTLLGAGGLIRAYAKSVQETVKVATVVAYKPYTEFLMELPFHIWGRLEAALLSGGAQLGEVEYTDKVKVNAFIPIGAEHAFQLKVAELSQGKVSPRECARTYLKLKI